MRAGRLEKGMFGLGEGHLDGASARGADSGGASRRGFRPCGSNRQAAASPEIVAISTGTPGSAAARPPRQPIEDVRNRCVTCPTRHRLVSPPY